jgi:glutamate formiminotransferase
MERVVECVPNFSEGRDPAVVARLTEAVEAVEGALVLGTHLDADHNRSVVTFVAPPDVVVEAALNAAAEHFLKLENYSPDLVLENRIAAALARKRSERGGEP